jgi:hypothetical protein
MKLPELTGAGSTVKEFGLRFNVVSLLPTTTLVLFILALFTSGAPGTSPSLRRMLNTIDHLSGTQLAAVALLVLLLALILHPLQLSLVRLLEGYWGPSAVGTSLSAIGVELHRRRRQWLAELTSEKALSTEQVRRKDWATSQLEGYPAEDRLLPTRLGNALRAAEDGASQRYGLPVVVMMPRLFPCLPDRFVDRFADLRNQLDIAARYCVVLMLATLISLPMLLPYGLWIAVPALTGVLSWTSYRSAVQAARSYGEGLYTAFDLYRFDLLRALRYPLPADTAEEARMNQKLRARFADGIPLPMAYKHEESDAIGGSTPRL